MASQDEKLEALHSYLSELWSRDPDNNDSKPSRLFETRQYPYQFKDPPEDNYESVDPDFMGELRGFYPDHNIGLSKAFFQPYNSLYHPKAHDPKNPKEVHRKHRGVDIYAPFSPFPHEIPLFAIAPGQLRRVWTYDRNINSSGSYQSLGNRLQLFVKVPLEKRHFWCRFDYGHLARFAVGFQPLMNPSGAPDAAYPVESGELIGFAGKSGNADSRKECSTLKPSYRVNSGHLHLSLRFGNALQDPSKVLPKKLAFHPDQKALNFTPPEAERYKRHLIVTWPDAAPEIKDALPGIVVAAGTLNTAWNAPLARRIVTKKTKAGAVVKRQARAILPAPFAAVDFDHSRSLRDTRNAYRALQTPKGVGAGFKIFADWMTATENPDTNQWDETVAALAARAAIRAGDIKKGAGKAVLKQNAAGVCLALMHLHEAMWALMGGPAFARLNKGRVQPACGLGLLGAVRAVAYPRAVAALHETTLRPKDAAKDIWGLSITFGSGSLRHATLTEDAMREGQAKEALKPFMETLNLLAIFLQVAFDNAYRNFARLQTGDADAVSTFSSLITSCKDEALLAASHARKWERKDFEDFVEIMANANSAAFDATLAMSNQREDPKQRPFSPSFSGLWLLQDGKRGAGS